MFCRPDRYVPLFGEYLYDLSKWRDAVPFIEQLQAMQDLIKEGKVVPNLLLVACFHY